jgi:hypothetical protein
MSILFNLTDVLAAGILTDWLEIADVVRMDSAACCGAGQQRRSLLATLYFPTTVYNTSPLLKDFNLRTADRFTIWLFSRNICVTGIYISRTFLLENDQRVNYLQRCGRSITTICSEDMDPHHVLPVIPFADLCRHCPNVVDITCPLDFTLSEYQTIAQTWPNLTRIVIARGACAESLFTIARNCRRLVHVEIDAFIAKPAKAQFVCELPRTVETLHYDSILRAKPPDLFLWQQPFRRLTCPACAQYAGDSWRGRVMNCC